MTTTKGLFPTTPATDELLPVVPDRPSRGALLIVDDEEQIRKMLRLQFRKDYDVFDAPSAEDGQRLMRTQEIHVIISDQRMPGQTGVEFFQVIRREFPDAVRLLLTGYTDIDTVIAAINNGDVFRYLTKPWNSDELRTVVKEAFDRHWLIVENRRLMSELRAANLDLEKRVQIRTRELAEINEQKDRLLGIAAHDLRSPLGVIESVAGLLLEEPDMDTEEQEKLLASIISTSRNLRNLVSSLLDSVKVKQGKIDINLLPVNLPEFVDNVLLLNQRICEAKGISLTSQVNCQRLDHVFDVDRIGQVVNNLISNAAKFSDSGTNIQLALSDGPEGLTLAVSDEGLGIEADDIPKLFGEFQLTQTKATAGESGSGLGLAICKRLVELHGGRIDVETRPAKGVAFGLPYRSHFLPPES